MTLSTLAIAAVADLDVDICRRAPVLGESCSQVLKRLTSSNRTPSFDILSVILSAGKEFWSAFNDKNIEKAEAPH